MPVPVMEAQNQRIEDLGPGIVEETAQIASEMRQMRFEREVEMQRWEEKQMKPEAEELRRRLNGFRETWLSEEVAHWHKSKLITEFANAAEEHLGRLGHVVVPLLDCEPPPCQSSLCISERRLAS